MMADGIETARKHRIAGLWRADVHLEEARGRIDIPGETRRKVIHHHHIMAKTQQMVDDV